MKIDHLSPTQINMYLKCSLSWYWRYSEGIVVPPKGLLTQSRCIHTAVETNFKQKIDTFLDLPTSDVLDDFSTEFDERKHLTVWQKDEKPSAFKDEGVSLLAGYHTKISPAIQPSHVEYKFELNFENFDISFVGRMDLIHNAIISDNKCSGKSPSVIAKEADSSLQLTAYALAYRAIFHSPEAGLSIIALLRPKASSKKLIDWKNPKADKPKSGKVETFSTTRDQKSIDRYLKLMAHVANAIENDIYFPRDPNSWECSSQYCGYHDTVCKEW